MAKPACKQREGEQHIQRAFCITFYWRCHAPASSVHSKTFFFNYNKLNIVCSSFNLNLNLLNPALSTIFSTTTASQAKKTKKQDKGQTFSRAKYFASLVALNLLRALWEYIFSAYIREWTSLPRFGILMSTFLDKCMFNLHGCASCVYAGGLPCFESVNLKGLSSDHCLHESTVTMTNRPRSMWTSGVSLLIVWKKKSNAVKNVTLTVLRASTAR